MPHAEANKPAQTVFKIVLAATLLLFISALSTNLVQAGDPEYVGTLESFVSHHTANRSGRKDHFAWSNEKETTWIARPGAAEVAR